MGTRKSRRGWIARIKVRKSKRKWVRVNNDWGPERNAETLLEVCWGKPRNTSPLAGALGRGEWGAILLIGFYNRRNMHRNYLNVVRNLSQTNVRLSMNGELIDRLIDRSFWHMNGGTMEYCTKFSLTNV